MENTTQGNDTSFQANNASYINFKFIKIKRSVIAIGIVALLIVVAIFFAKSLFIAALVNGSPITRLSVIKELEEQGGKQALESLISRKLINAELDNQKIIVTKEEVDEEIQLIKEKLTAQSETLEMALTQQGMTEEGLREEITVQKKIEKLLADKIVVTDAEIDAYLKDSKATPFAGENTEDFRIQISEQLRQQKFQLEAQKWVSNLMASSQIKYYINY